MKDTQPLSLTAAQPAGLPAHSAALPGPPSSALMTVSAALDAFLRGFHKEHNYRRLVRRYLLFCLEKNYLIGPVSFALYKPGKSPSDLSPVSRFVKFAGRTGLTQVVADPIAPTRTPSANAYILAFLHESKTLRTADSLAVYNRSLNALFAYLDSGNLPLDGTTINRYVLGLRDKGLSPFTINLRLAAIKQFTAWLLASCERLSLSLTTAQVAGMSDVKNVRGLSVEGRFYKESLDEGQREALLAACSDGRDLAVLAVLAYCGLRTVEVTRLRWSDLDLEGRRLHVLGKGHNTRRPVKIFGAATGALRAYLQAVPASDQLASARLFEGLTTPRSVQRLADKYLRLAGLKKRMISPHSLRHTAGQLMLKEGVEPMYVQMHLRHERFETTRFYILRQLQSDYMANTPD